MKKGFSLIELVLTIVVVSIAIMALPTIVMQTQRSNEMALKQELTLQAKSMIGRILSAPWDSSHLNQRFNGLRNVNPACDDIDNALVQESTNTCWIDLNTPIYNAVNNVDEGIVDRPGTNLVDDYAKRAISPERPKGGRGDGADDVIFTSTDSDNFGDIDAGSFGINPVGRNDIDDYGNGSESGNFHKSVTPADGDFLSDMNFITRVEYSLDIDGTTTSIFDPANAININNNNDVKRVVVVVSDSDEATQDESVGDNRVKLVYYAPNIGDGKVVIKKWE